jgi:hypothetical protein
MLSFPHTSSDRRNAPLARAGTACRGPVTAPPEHVDFLTRRRGRPVSDDQVVASGGVTTTRSWRGPT